MQFVKCADFFKKTNIATLCPCNPFQQFILYYGSTECTVCSDELTVTKLKPGSNGHDSPGVVNRTFENRTQSNSIELNPWIEFD